MTFLQQTRRISPKMYIFFLIFIAGTIFSHIFRISSTPFYVYGMYAAPVPVTSEFSFMVVVEDGKTVYNKPEIWNHHKRIAVYYSSRTRDQMLHSADFQKENDFSHRIFPDKKAMAQDYPKWLLRYIADMEGKNLKSVGLYKFTVKYDEAGNYKLKKVEKIFTESK